MLEKISMSLKTEFREYTRSPWLPIAFALCILYGVWGLTRSQENMNILNLAYHTQYFQILAMLLIGYVGLHLTSKENRLSLTNTLNTIPAAKQCVQFSKLLFGVLLSAAFWLVYGVIFSGIALKKGSSFSLLGHCLSFFCLYGVLPGFCMLLAGLIAGYRLHGVGMYAAVVLAWIILSPFSSFAMRGIATVLNLRNSSFGHPDWYLFFFHFLSLGTPISLDSAPTYGLITEAPFWLQHIVVLLFFLILWYLFCPSRRHGLCAMIPSAAFLAVFLFVGSVPEIRAYFVNYPYQFTGRTSNEDYRSEMYDVTEQGNFLRADAIPDYDAAVSFKPVSYDVSLDTGMIFTGVSCDLRLCALRETERQTFTLYAGFDVKAVSMNGEPLVYERDGDYLLVHFPQTIPSMEIITLSIAYSGWSSPLYPANQTCVSLPSSYPWLPRLGMLVPPEESHIAGVREIVLNIPWIDAESVDYTLRFDNGQTTYANLTEKTGRSVWRGSSRYGLSVYSHPLMSCAEIGGLTVYYPESAAPFRTELLEKAAALHDARGEVVQLLNLPVFAESGDQVVVPVTNAYSANYSVLCEFVNEDVVFCMDNSGLISPALRVERALSDAIQGITEWHAHYLLANTADSINMVMRNGLEFWMNQHEYMPETSAASFWKSGWESDIEMGFAQNPEEYRIVHEALDALFSQEDPSPGIQLFSEYYSDLFSGKYWTARDFMDHISAINS